MHDRSGISVRLAASPVEVRAAQRLRYKVFYEEWGAIPNAIAAVEERDIEAFDDATEHLIVVDRARAEAGVNCGVVGNYRLRRNTGHPGNDVFYSSHEFDITPLLRADARLLELGRSCVLREYRRRPVLQLLWKALAHYVADHRIDIMFGCASFRGTDASLIDEQLAYLYHYHLAQAGLRPHAIGPDRIAMDRLSREQVDPARAIRQMEPLIRGYLRLGAGVGMDAYLDREFNAIDVCVVLPTADLSAKYVRHYEREEGLQLRRGAVAETTDDVAVACLTQRR